MKNKVKRIFIGVFASISIAFTSCSPLTQDEIVKKNAEEYFKSKMNDAQSYEFVKLELIDSLLYRDNIEYHKESEQESYKKFKGNIESQEFFKEKYPKLYDEEEYLELKKNIEDIQLKLSKIDSIETQLGDKKNEAVSYTYIFSFRGNNAFGAKVLNEYYVITKSDPDFEVYNVVQSHSLLEYYQPRDYPGKDK
jgi:hypothetical protein